MKKMVENSKTARKRFENGSETARKRLVNVGRFLAVLLVLLTIGIGNAWGADLTWTYKNGSDGLSNKYPITVTYGAGSADNTTTVTGEGDNRSLRLYQHKSDGNGSWITFTAGTGYQITAIQVVFSDKRTTARGKIDTGDWTEAFSSGNSNTVDITSLTASSYSIKNGQNNDNTAVTVKIASITITYESASSDPYTVTYNAEGGTCGTSSETEASAGAGVTLPDASPSTECDSEGWALYGWATSACSSATGTAPTIVGKAGETYYPSDDITLHAVYAKGEYTKETTSITSDAKYLIVGNTGGHNYIMKSSSDDFKDYSGYNGMDAAQIDETSTGKYHATVINSSWCYTIEGTAGSYYIRDVVNSSSSNYADIAYAAWWGHSKDETYTITVSSGIWTIQNNYDDDGYAYLGFDDSDLAFFAYGSAKDILLYRQTTTPSYFSNPDCIYDYFVDKVHGNEIDPKQGTYSMPASPGDEAKGDASCAEEHYHFMGWVEDVYVNRNGTLKSGYTLYPAGHSGHTAANKTFYAIWAAEE